MRTTLDLPESLLKEAMKVSHQKTKTAVIVTALNDLIRKNKLQQLRAYRGKVDIDLDLNQLRKRS
ncbi:type II toxin-antitoxin system VapB family antitoxin [Oscillatoria amoena NRMC-F 0135]|nr:type II toxin-antitoxin system VapB family antitoxin [Oscillatoria laete-virens]MDL5050600.1 type II toxin-antitoxin system VapB family antitoxin [Oscillatoria amoena NRMC-F 0135]MDL5055614.1 type II toxin-antitoxin system VapB family antitoxin [Oscillatoria laete-virens NRMC-F 0139]